MRNTIAGDHGQEIAAIFDFHLGLLRDKTVVNQIAAEIRNNRATAEHAVSIVMRRLAGTFQRMSDRFFSERVKDIYDIEKRLLRKLIGQQHQDLSRLEHDVVIIARDLLPSQAAHPR